MNNSLLQQRAQSIVDQFNKFTEWEDRYKALIELGKKLPALPEQYRIERNLVKGCQSQVWLQADLKTTADANLLILQADSDAMIVKGLVAVLLQVYSGAPVEEIVKFEPTFIRDLGFEANLSPSRANGLFSMIKQIRLYAMAFMLKSRT